MSTSSKTSFNHVDQSISMLTDTQTFVKAGMELTKKFAVDYANINNSDSINALQGLRDTMLSFCQMDRDVEQFIEATTLTKNQCKGGNTKDLLEKFEQQLNVLKRRTDKESIENHTKYVEMEELISDLIEPDEPAPVPQIVDEDLVMVQTQTTTRCPYTGQEMVNPFTNKLCGHSYDFDGIEKFIKDKGIRARCPVSGCVNEKPLQLQDLEENKQLKKLIKRKRTMAANLAS